MGENILAEKPLSILENIPLNFQNPLHISHRIYIAPKIIHATNDNDTDDEDNDYGDEDDE